MRFLLKDPLTVSKGQVVQGNIKLVANKQQSFNMILVLRIPDVKAESKGEYEIKDVELKWNLMSNIDRYFAMKNINEIIRMSSHITIN